MFIIFADLKKLFAEKKKKTIQSLEVTLEKTMYLTNNH